jgi:hypothetical protein
VPHGWRQEDLGHICKLIKVKNPYALKGLPRSSNPKVEYRWLLVGWNLVSGPRLTG